MIYKVLVAICVYLFLCSFVLARVDDIGSVLSAVPFAVALWNGVFTSAPSTANKRPSLALLISPSFPM